MDRKDLAESRRYLSDIGVWPGPRYADPEAWLDNFDPEDVEIAQALLDSFVHIDEDQIAYAVCSTIRSISARPEFGSVDSRQENWRAFLSRAIVAIPLGFSGDVSASGHIFARIAHRLGIPESRLRDTEHLVRELAAPGRSAPVIFLDDIAASGTQFRRNWRRQHPTDHGRLSLADLLGRGSLEAVYYLPVVSTAKAKEAIESECAVVVDPTYVLDDDYSAASENTRLVPDHLKDRLRPFLEKYAPRTDRNQYGPLGYDDLGLALSFHHGTPNNTLPLLQRGPAGAKWSPLIHD